MTPPDLLSSPLLEIRTSPQTFLASPLSSQRTCIARTCPSANVKADVAGMAADLADLDFVPTPGWSREAVGGARPCMTIPSAGGQEERGLGRHDGRFQHLDRWPSSWVLCAYRVSLLARHRGSRTDRRWSWSLVSLCPLSSRVLGADIGWVESLLRNEMRCAAASASTSDSVFIVPDASLRYVLCACPASRIDVDSFYRYACSYSVHR